jgi:hypothetical protein
MGYSIKDIEHAAKGITDGISERLEARSQRQGEELANRILASTSQGRGLWLVILLPAWILIFAFSGVLFSSVLTKFGLKPPISYAGFVGGFLFARAWYFWSFTIRHPFWGSAVGYFATAMGTLFLTEEFGL